MPAPKRNVAGNIVKKVIKKVKPELKGTLKTPKPNVKVKPAAKQKPNKPNAAKTIFKNDSSRNRAGDKAYKKMEAETNKYKVEERTGYEHRWASDAAERAGNNAKLSPRIARRDAATNPVAKKALKADKKANKKYWQDMRNSIDG